MADITGSHSVRASDDLRCAPVLAKVSSRVRAPGTANRDDDGAAAASSAAVGGHDRVARNPPTVRRVSFWSDPASRQRFHASSEREAGIHYPGAPAAAFLRVYRSAHVHWLGPRDRNVAGMSADHPGGDRG